MNTKEKGNKMKQKIQTKRAVFPGLIVSMSFVMVISLLLIELSSAQIPFGKCTSLLIGKHATTDMSVLITQSNDSGNSGGRIRYIPAADHKQGEKRIVQLWNEYGRLGVAGSPQVRSGPTLEIPQVRHTYSYFECVFPLMNEKQVSVAEATLGEIRKELAPTKESDAKLKITDVSRIALERASTAREAIKIMASLMEEHGFNSWLGAGEYFAVADKNEAWCFEFIPVGPVWKKDSGEPGVCWCAMRIPDDKFAVVANESLIGEIDLDDTENFMASSNVKSLAVKNGWWDPGSGKPFRWDLAYFGKKANSLRTWRALSLVAPSQKLKPFQEGYPNPIKPDKKLSILDVRKIHGDHFEGTEFDQTKGLAAGPFGNPNWPRGTPNAKRALAVTRSDDIVIRQCRSWLPDPIGGVMWVGLAGGGDTMVYVPFYVGVTRLPKAYTTCIRTKFSWDSAFWVFNLVGSWAQLDYCHVIEEIKMVQNMLEKTELNDQPAVDEEAYALFQKDPVLARRFLSKYCIENADKVIETWKELAYHLIARYNPASVNAPVAPEWWRKALSEKEK